MDKKLKKTLIRGVIILMMMPYIFSTSVLAKGQFSQVSVFHKKDHRNGHSKQKYISIASKLLGTSKDDLKKQLDSGKSLYDLLNEKGKVEEFKEEVLKEMKKHLDDEIKSGKLTKEKADEIYVKKQSKISSWDGKEPLGFNKEKFFHEEEFAKIASDVLGMSEEELKNKINSGKKIGDILKEAGKLEEFKTKAIEAFKKELDKKVKDKKLEKDKADKIFNKFKEKMKDWNGEY